jgi:hypothetical protein
MLRAPERDPFAAGLQRLVQRFAAEEQAMVAALQALNAELELCHRNTAFVRLGDVGALATDALLRHCRALQGECDHLATELVHVRMAVQGAGEEFAEHVRRSA